MRLKYDGTKAIERLRSHLPVLTILITLHWATGLEGLLENSSWCVKESTRSVCGLCDLRFFLCQKQMEHGELNLRLPQLWLNKHIFVSHITTLPWWLKYIWQLAHDSGIKVPTQCRYKEGVFDKHKMLSKMNDMVIPKINKNLWEITNFFFRFRISSKKRSRCNFSQPNWRWSPDPTQCPCTIFGIVACTEESGSGTLIFLHSSKFCIWYRSNHPNWTTLMLSLPAFWNYFL